jgi:hypothetical protein
VTKIRPLAGSTTAPARPQIAESLAAHVDGWINPLRLEQSEFQTWSSLPFDALITATWP